MSAEILRRAARQIRSGYEHCDDGYEDRFMLAVADWLDATAAENDSDGALEFLNFVGQDALAAVAAARAYLLDDDLDLG